MKVKKFLKGLMTAALTVTMAVTPVASVMSNSLTVFAAPETMPDGTIFDADYYAQTYPDVVNVLGTDRDALYNHYVTFGKAEGRMAYAPTTTAQADKTPTEPSTQSKDPLTAATTPTQALAYASLLPEFMLTDSRPSGWYTSGRYATKSNYVYDAYGNLTEYCVCDEEGRIVGYNDIVWHRHYNCVYNEQGQLIQLKWDEDNNRKIQFYYDDRGRLIKIDANATVTPCTISYNEQERIISSVTDYGYGDYIFDEQGRLIKCSYSLYAETSVRDKFTCYQYEYDSSGKLVRYIRNNTEIIRSSGKIDSSDETIYEYVYN